MDSCAALIQQNKEIMLQVKQFELQYNTLDKMSLEALAVSVTISELLIRYVAVQKDILSYQRREI